MPSWETFWRDTNSMGKWFSKEVKNVNSETVIVAAGNKSDSVVDHDAVQYGIFSLMLCVLISIAVYTFVKRVINWAKKMERRLKAVETTLVSVRVENSSK